MSGVYIKGMEMPKPKLADMAIVYDAYILVSPNGHAAIVVDNEDGLDSTEYPLVPVPPHGRLGDLDELKERATKRLYASNHGSMAEAYYASIIDLIDSAPTIIPAELAEEALRCDPCKPTQPECGTCEWAEEGKK